MGSLLLHSHSLYRHATLLPSCGKGRLRDDTKNSCHADYNPWHSTWVTLLWYLPSLFQYMLFWNRFSVDLSKFEANIEEREKEVKQSMSTLFLLLTQVLMSQVIGSCPGEGHWVLLAQEMSLPIWQKVTLEVKKKALYLSVNVFSTKALIGTLRSLSNDGLLGHYIFTSPTGDGTVILRGHPSHAKV